MKPVQAESCAVLYSLQAKCLNKMGHFLLFFSVGDKRQITKEFPPEEWIKQCSSHLCITMQLRRSFCVCLQWCMSVYLCGGSLCFIALLCSTIEDQFEHVLLRLYLIENLSPGILEVLLGWAVQRNMCHNTSRCFNNFNKPLIDHKKQKALPWKLPRKFKLYPICMIHC